MRRNKLVLLFIVSLVLCVFLAACRLEINILPSDSEPSTGQTPIEQVLPTTVPPTEVPPTEVPPTPTDMPPTPTPEPLETFDVVDMGNGFWLTFDTQYWEINNERGYNFLQSKNYDGCNIMYQFGHGMDWNTYEADMTPKTLGGKEFNVTRWTRISNGDLILLAFYYGEEYISVEGPNAETLPAECETQAYDVVILSAEKDFKP